MDSERSSAPSRLVASHLRDFAEFLPVEKREDFNATIDDLVDRLATAYEANTALDRALRSDTAPLSPKSENSRDNAQMVPQTIHEKSNATSARCVSVPIRNACSDLVEEYDQVRADYHKYYEGDARMPFATVRYSLDKFFAEADRLIKIIRVLAAAPDATDTNRSAVADIAAERQRQIEKEGWDTEHDDEHPAGSLALAGMCYAQNAAGQLGKPYSPVRGVPAFWPWEPAWWKPKDARRDLVRAAALIVAEIERLDRQSERPEK